MTEPRDLSPGLYEELVTEGLRRQLEELTARGWTAHEARADGAVAADLLSRHIARVLGRILSMVSDERRVEAANQVLAIAGALTPEAYELADPFEPGPLELHDLAPDSALARVAYIRPQIPLSRADLLVNARGEPTLAHEIAAELSSSDRVDLVCAFVKWYGLRLIVEPLHRVRQRGVPVRVITTTYVGATERRALDELVRLGAEVKINYETQRTRLHAKAWLFHRRSGMDTAYVGSSNLSRSALVDGLEWNVRLARAETPALIDKFAATFESYWQQAAFETYVPERDGERLDAALGVAIQRQPLRLSGLEIRPYDYQQEILDRLDAERQVHDRFRNLVVAATGTGKTVVAAFDYRRLRYQLGGDPTLLFVAHRKEILDQSQRTFAEVLVDPTFGEMYVGGERPERWRHVFASVQSLTAMQIDRIDPGHFDVVVIDEFHHAEARTYQRILDHLRPRVLLGLTATPERADGQDVTRWFGGHVAAELRLWEALEKELLCPFHYFGISDGVDLSSIEWRRGGYDVSELERIYTGNDARARLILKGVEEKLPDPQRMRALGFCVSKAHAAYMAHVFEKAGIAATTVDADTPMHDRQSRRRALRDGDVNVIFSVDVFNEGLDVPEVDTVLFLRPTESLTVFLQQLGRGLRQTAGKTCLTALDFIGNQNRRFRFDLRYRAITGASRRGLERQIEEGFPFLPSGCNIELDHLATRMVLANIRTQIRMSRADLAADLKSHGDLSLRDYLRESGRELVDVYRQGASWTSLRRQAGFAPSSFTEGDDVLLSRMYRFARVDDMERVNTWGSWLRDDRPSRMDALDTRLSRPAKMLFFNLWPGGGDWNSLQGGLDHLWTRAVVRGELVELLEVAADGIHRVPVPLTGPRLQDVPLYVHSQYSREELLSALGVAALNRLPRADMQGVRYSEAVRADIFTFTMQKSERDYSPTTMYRDYPISPELIHWESQNTTSASSRIGQRYIHHQEQGTQILLFGRQTNEDDLGARPYLFLGPAQYVSHEGSRPIAFVWRLQHPLPADFFAAARVAAG